MCLLEKLIIATAARDRAGKAIISTDSVAKDDRVRQTRRALVPPRRDRKKILLDRFLENPDTVIAANIFRFSLAGRSVVWKNSFSSFTMRRSVHREKRDGATDISLRS